jgi:hypothetical protein
VVQKINSAKFWPLSQFFIALIFLLAGCSSMPNPLDSPMVESMSTGISDFFVKDEEIVYDKEELDVLKAAEAIPLKWKTKVKKAILGISKQLMIVAHYMSLMKRVEWQNLMR